VHHKFMKEFKTPPGSGVLHVGQPEPLPFIFCLGAMKTYREMKYIFTHYLTTQ